MRFPPRRPTRPLRRAALRQSTPERLRRLYRGDIDNVLAKALEKDPRRRYESVTAFTDDIRRFLHHEPLSVQGRAWSYRAAKFIRRHRWPVAAAAAAFVTLSAGLLIANQQRRIAESRFRQLRHLSQQVFQLDSHIQAVRGQPRPARRSSLPRSNTSRACRATREATSICCKK